MILVSLCNLNNMLAVQKHQNFLTRINAKYGQKKIKKKKAATGINGSIAAEIFKTKATAPKNLEMLEDHGI